ncbi:MAG: pilin [bacterium]|nr:pilin [bacterium]
MKKILYLLALFIFPLISLAQAPAPACDGVICNPLGNNADITVLVDRIVNFLLYLAGPIAVIMTVYAGFLFITGGDKPEQVKKARQMLLWIVIGVIVLILSKSAVVFVESFLK